MKINIECEKVKLKDPVLFLGLPGIGLVGKIVIDTLINKTKAKKIGSISGDVFPPVVFASTNGIIKESSDEIYLCKGEKRDFLFIAGDFQPNLESPEAFESHHVFAEEILKFAKTSDVKEIYSFAGINVGDVRITKDPQVFFVTANKEKAKELKEFIKPVDRDTTISGIAGLVLSKSKKHTIPSICILGETTNKIYGDFESAKNVLVFLDKSFKLKIDLKEIETEAKKISNAFKQVVKELKTLTQTHLQEMTPGKTTYIR